jgi:L-arabinose isomerase
VGGAFRFSGTEPVEVVWRRWAEAGVNHHSAAAPGHLADQVEIVARFLGIGFVRAS